MVILVAMLLLSAFSVSATAENAGAGKSVDNASVNNADVNNNADLSVGKDIKVALDVTYMSKYMSYGSEGYGSDSGIFVHTIIDFWDSGFGMKIGYQGANGGGHVDDQRYNYNFFYKGVAFEDKSYVTKYHLNARYEHYYRTVHTDKYAQEYTVTLSWPEILGIENLSPYFIYDYEQGRNRTASYRNAHGRSHNRSDDLGVIGLAYLLHVQELENPIKLTSDITYCDGFYGGANKCYDWSHVTFGASTKFKLSDNLTFTPGLYQQISMDKAVCDGDVTYCSLNLRYTF